MAKSDPLFSLSSLLCKENEKEASFNVDEAKNKYMDLDPCFVSEEDEDCYIQNLLEREISSFRSIRCFSSDGSSNSNHSWLKCGRLDAIEWVLNTREIFGFHFHTVFLSVIYLDRFLSKRSIDDGKLWAIQLLSVACLSIAAKMGESKVPTLSEFPVEGYGFENEMIQRMELLVLNALEWKMSSITPFSYIPYMVKRLCGQSKVSELMSRAIELVESIIKEINFTDHRPSTVAAAAVLAAYDFQLTKETMELKLSVISPSKHLDNEQIFSLYNLMLVSMRGILKTPNSEISPHASSVSSSPQLSVSSATTTKRRLSYDNSDKGSPLKKISRS